MSNIVDIIFRVNDQATAALERMRASLAESSRQWQRAGREVQRVGRQVQNVGASLTKSLTVPIVGAGTIAVSKFAQVDKTMSLVNATMGNSTKESQKLNDAMSKVAMNSTFGMNDAAQAALNFARGGWDAAQASEALAPAMNLAAGAGGDLDTVSAGLMATMNAFKAPANEATHYADVFANACNNSALDVNSLSQAMSIAAPIFKTGGLTVNDAALAMGVMANNGTDANVAANALKSGMARLASPTKDAQTWLKKLNIEAFDSNGKMKSMATLQSELNRSFGNLTAKEKESAASSIFGKNQMSAWLGLIDTGPDKVNKLSNSLTKQSTAAKMSSAMMEGFGGSIEKLKSSFDVFMTNMGKPIGEVLTPFIKKIQEMVDKYNSLDDSQRKQIVKFAMMAAAIGPATMAFGKLVKGVGGAYKMVGSFGQLCGRLPGIATTISGAFGSVKSIGGIFAALKTSIAAIAGPAGVVIAVLAGIAAASVLIWKNWDKVKAFGEKAFKGLEPVINMFKETFEGMKNTVSEGIESIKEAVSNAAKPVINQVNNIKKKLAELAQNESFQKFLSIVKQVAGALISIELIKIKYAFESTFNAITNVVKVGIETIGKVLEGITKAFGGVIDFINGIFKGNWKQAWGGLKDTFKGIFDSLVAIAKAPLKAVMGVVSGIAKAIGNIKFPDWVPLVGGKKLSEAFSPVTKTFSKVGSAFGRFKNNLVKGFGNLKNNVGNAIKPITKKLSEFGEVFEGIKKKVSGIISSIVNKFKQWANSPAVQNIIKAINSIRKHIVNFGKVVGEKVGEVIAWFKKLGDNPVFQKIVHVIKDILVESILFALEKLKATFTAVFDAIGNVIQVAVDTISGVINGVTEVFSGLIDFLTGVFTGNWEKAWSGIKDIFKGIADSLVEIIKAPINAIIGIINGAISGINSISVKIPSWVPGMGGKTFSPDIPKISPLYKGTDYWQGGLAQINERGGEIVDLPQGTRVYPHDKSVKKAYADGARNSSINIAKIADTIVVREDADIDRIAAAIAHKLEIARTDMAY